MSAAARKPPAKRAYRSPLREEQARATRQRVVEAAYRLFVADGYPRTSIASVAAEAGVAVDTVYHLFGTKGGLMQAVMDVTVGGDDADVAVLDRPDKQVMRLESSPRRQVQVFAAGMTEQLARVGPVWEVLIGAAAVDPDLARLRDDIQLRQRRMMARTVAGWLAARGPFRDDLTVDDVAAVIWTATSPEVFGMFRNAWGWDADRYRHWLEDLLLRTVIGPARAASHSRR